MAQHSVGAIMLMVGSLPSRALGMMVFIGQHLATPDEVDELFITCLSTSGWLTSADVVWKSTIRCKFPSDYVISIKQIDYVILTKQIDYVISTKQSAWRNLRGSANINVFYENNILSRVAVFA